MSDEVHVYEAIEGKVTIGLTSDLFNNQVETNLSPDRARSIADRLRQKADEVES